jgi:hypothetical protein
MPRGKVLAIADVEPGATVYAQSGRRWRDDLALWATRHDGGRHLAGCVVQLTAPELTADQLLGAAELAELAGIAASTLRAYMARGESEVPLPQATVGGRAMWSRPVAEVWAEPRRRSHDGVASTMADRDHSNLAVGVTDLWAAFTKAFVVDLWERAGHRKRFALRWRTPAAVRDLAQDLAWTVAASLNRIIPLGDLGTTIRAAVLWEFAEWQKLTQRDEPPVSYPLKPQVTRMLDWLIRHDPGRARAVVAEIVGEAVRELEIPADTAGYSLRQALSLDGKLTNHDAYEHFMDLALPPQE